MPEPRDLADAIAHSHDEAVGMSFLLQPSPRVTHVERLPDSGGGEADPSLGRREASEKVPG